MFAFFGKRDRFNIKNFVNLYLNLTKAKYETKAQRQAAVDIIKQMSEQLVFGDQNNVEQIFDFFCEKNMMALFLDIAKQDTGTAVQIQLIQTVSILVQNISSRNSLYYMLSNNHVNDFIVAGFDVTDEDVLAVFISFLKTLSGILNEETIHFFCNDRVKENPFALYTEAIKYYNHENRMVRIAVRTVTLNIFRVKDARMRDFLTHGKHAAYLNNVVYFFSQQIVDFDQALRRVHVESVGLLESQISDVIDTLYYLQDVVDTGIDTLTEDIVGALNAHILKRIVFPSLRKASMKSNTSDTQSISSSVASPVALQTQGQSVQVDAMLAMYILAHVFVVMPHPRVANTFAAEVLEPRIRRMQQLGGGLRGHRTFSSPRFFAQDSAEDLTVGRSRSLEMEASDGVRFEREDSDSVVSASTASNLSLRDRGLTSVKQVLLSFIAGPDQRRALGACFVLWSMLKAETIDPVLLQSADLHPAGRPLKQLAEAVVVEAANGDNSSLAPTVMPNHAQPAVPPPPAPTDDSKAEDSDDSDSPTGELVRLPSRRRLVLPPAAGFSSYDAQAATDRPSMFMLNQAVSGSPIVEHPDEDHEADSPMLSSSVGSRRLHERGDSLPPMQLDLPTIESPASGGAATPPADAASAESASGGDAAEAMPTQSTDVDGSSADITTADGTPAEAAPSDTTPSTSTPTEAAPSDTTPSTSTPAEAAPSDTTPIDAASPDAVTATPTPTNWAGTPSDTTSGDNAPADGTATTTDTFQDEVGMFVTDEAAAQEAATAPLDNSSVVSDHAESEAADTTSRQVAVIVGSLSEAEDGPLSRTPAARLSDAKPDNWSASSHCHSPSAQGAISVQPTTGSPARPVSIRGRGDDGSFNGNLAVAPADEPTDLVQCLITLLGHQPPPRFVNTLMAVTVLEQLLYKSGPEVCFNVAQQAALDKVMEAIATQISLAVAWPEALGGLDAVVCIVEEAAKVVDRCMNVADVVDHAHSLLPLSRKIHIGINLEFRLPAQRLESLQVQVQTFLLIRSMVLKLMKLEDSEDLVKQLVPPQGHLPPDSSVSLASLPWLPGTLNLPASGGKMQRLCVVLGREWLIFMDAAAGPDSKQVEPTGSPRLILPLHRVTSYQRPNSAFVLDLRVWSSQPVPFAVREPASVDGVTTEYSVCVWSLSLVLDTPDICRHLHTHIGQCHRSSQASKLTVLERLLRDRCSFKSSL